MAPHKFTKHEAAGLGAALAALEDPAAGEFRDALRDFLARHGHRGESEMAVGPQNAIPVDVIQFCGPTALCRFSNEDRDQPLGPSLILGVRREGRRRYGPERVPLLAGLDE